MYDTRILNGETMMNDSKGKDIRMKCWKCDTEFFKTFFTDGHTDKDPINCPNCVNNDKTEIGMYMGE